MNKLWSIINYSVSIILALTIILLPFFESLLIASSLFAIVILSFLVQIFKDKDCHKFFNVVTIVLSAMFITLFLIYEKDSLLYIAGAVYVLWLLISFFFDLALDWKSYPLERFFEEKPKEEMKEEKEVKQESKVETEKEEFGNYLEYEDENDDEEDDEEIIIQAVGEQKKKLPYKLFTKKNTLTFHRENCRTLKKARVSDLIELHSLEEAQAYDLKPCRVCKPGE